MPSTQFYRQLDFSGAVQTATSNLLRRRNEVEKSKNAAFNIKIGSAVRRPGYEQVGETLQHGKDSLYGGVFRYFTNHKIIAGINNSTDTNATLRYMDTGGYWVNIISDAPVSTRFDCLNYLDELYVVGANGSNQFVTTQNVDSTMVPSTTRNVMFAPKSKFITDFNGRVIAINVMVDGVHYKDRFYQSSLPLGAITFVQTDQGGILNQLRVDSVKYLKPGMTIDIYGASTGQKKVDSLTIVSIDKNNKRITFLPKSLQVKDNDEVWLEDRKGKLSIFWNVDHPTPESADWRNVPPSAEEDAEFTAYGKNNNRLLLFTRNSMLKYDGANLITVSDTIGCVAPQSVKNIGAWTLFLHTTGIWAYNDSTGDLKLLSKAVENYINAINQATMPYASAIVVGKMYKLAAGEIAELDSLTTSTSTSSTSTSSTSSSTSSTSTSSTSTSFTSSSTSSSTSTTTLTTTSTSTSSTSTSTTTSPSTKQVLRLVYDFELNAWWPEYHRRDIRFQLNHNMHGYTKPYFTDDTGRLFRDETGNMDHFDTIPFYLELGRNTFNSEFRKRYIAAVVESYQAATAQLAAKVDGGESVMLGQLDSISKDITFPPTLQGRGINYIITHNDSGQPPEIKGITTEYSIEESTHANARRS